MVTKSRKHSITGSTSPPVHPMFWCKVITVHLIWTVFQLTRTIYFKYNILQFSALKGQLNPVLKHVENHPNTFTSFTRISLKATVQNKHLVTYYIFFQCLSIVYWWLMKICKRFQDNRACKTNAKFRWNLEHQT